MKKKKMKEIVFVSRIKHFQRPNNSMATYCDGSGFISWVIKDRISELLVRVSSRGERRNPFFCYYIVCVDKKIV